MVVIYERVILDERVADVVRLGINVIERVFVNNEQLLPGINNISSIHRRRLILMMEHTVGSFIFLKEIAYLLNEWVIIKLLLLIID